MMNEWKQPITSLSREGLWTARQHGEWRQSAMQQSTQRNVTGSPPPPPPNHAHHWMSSKHSVVTEQITWRVTTTSANTSLYNGKQGADGVAIVSLGRRSHSAQYSTDTATQHFTGWLRTQAVRSVLGVLTRYMHSPTCAISRYANSDFCKSK